MQVFSCEIDDIFKNNFFIEHLRWLLRFVSSHFFHYLSFFSET